MFYKNSVSPSKLLEKAIQAKAASLDNFPIEIAIAENIEVLVLPGQVKKGAVVMGESQVCDTLDCPIVFVPNVPWRKKCLICSPMKK